MSKGEETRQRIISKAAPLFNRKGFEGASMQEVMAVTGLEKGGLYRHFSSKEELAAEAFRYSLSQAKKTRTDGIDEIPGTIERLRFLIRRFVDAPSPIEGGCPLMNTAVDTDDGNPQLRKLVRQGFADWRQRLSSIIAEGVEAKEIRKDVAPRQLANTIIALLEGALMLSRIEGTKVPLEDAQISLDLLLVAIRAEKAR
jgi:AcrR family transcriptional regulator